MGKDVLLIESLDGAEGISRLFEFHVELLRLTDTEIDPKAIMGTKVSVSIASTMCRVRDGSTASSRRLSRRRETKSSTSTGRELCPSMWQLTLSANCRVFQNKTVLEIVKEVFGEYGLSLSDQTSKSYKKLEYCTQYSESDFHFVSRLMEESGIFYWFEHTDQDNKIASETAEAPIRIARYRHRSLMR